MTGYNLLGSKKLRGSHDLYGCSCSKVFHIASYDAIRRNKAGRMILHHILEVRHYNR